jgi:Vacuolar 14 Fab1-binding region
LNPVLRCFGEKDSKVQQAACDALFNIIKIVKEAILDDTEMFKNIFNKVLDLIYEIQSEVKDWAKSVDDLLKNQVYTALSKGYPFDLEQLIMMISERLKVTPNPEVIIILIKWVEVLHSIQNVNILPSIPKFLERLLTNIDNKNGINQKTEVSKKSNDLLNLFLEEFQSPMSRSVKLDKKIINKLLNFLLNSTGATQKQIPVVTSMGTNKLAQIVTLENSKREALIWLRHFLDFFLQDFTAWQKEEENYIQM